MFWVIYVDWLLEKERKEHRRVSELSLYSVAKAMTYKFLFPVAVKATMV